jgi:hypothetical protein
MFNDMKTPYVLNGRYCDPKNLTIVEVEGSSYEELMQKICEKLDSRWESRPKLGANNNIVCGNTSISFNRTIRVPDCDTVYSLPPGLGSFPLISNSKLYDPSKEVREAQNFDFQMPIYKHEAMWISTEINGALRMSVGNTCAVSGKPWSEKLETHPLPQNYLWDKQPWIDGMAIDENTVRQFVCSEFGQTIDSANGREDSNIINFHFYKRIPQIIGFLKDGKWIEPSEIKATKDAPEKFLLFAMRTSINIPCENHPIQGNVTDTSGMLTFFVHTLTGKNFPVTLTEGSTTLDAKNFIQNQESIPPDQQRLIFMGKELDNCDALEDYGIQEGSTVYLVLRLRGGGGGNVGINLGGKIKQKIFPDQNNRGYYPVGRIRIALVNAATFPGTWSTPISPVTYIQRGLPWFNYRSSPSPAGQATSVVPSVAVKRAIEDEDDECAICCTNCENVGFSCGHRTCSDCFQKMLFIYKDACVCPFCRDKDIVKSVRIEGGVYVSAEFAKSMGGKLGEKIAPLTINLEKF